MIGLNFIGGIGRVRDVSRPLQSFFLKCGICQLMYHEYDMSMPIFRKYLVTVLLINCYDVSYDMVR